MADQDQEHRSEKDVDYSFDGDERYEHLSLHSDDTSTFFVNIVDAPDNVDDG
jgi:hypothetical protein